jgi:hypothetical protein
MDLAFDDKALVESLNGGRCQFLNLFRCSYDFIMQKPKSEFIAVNASLSWLTYVIAYFFQFPVEDNCAMIKMDCLAAGVAQRVAGAVPSNRVISSPFSHKTFFFIKLCEGTPYFFLVGNS